ncbi:hypothetical protein LCGC14_2372820, partial [marine sediment metagenome]
MPFKIAIKDGKKFAVEDHEDGTFTLWSPSIWGCIGNSGKPAKDVTIKKATNKQERELISTMIARMERSQKSQQALLQ